MKFPIFISLTAIALSFYSCTGSSEKKDSVSNDSTVISGDSAAKRLEITLSDENQEERIKTYTASDGRIFTYQTGFGPLNELISTKDRSGHLAAVAGHASELDFWCIIAECRDADGRIGSFIFTDTEAFDEYPDSVRVRQLAEITDRTGLKKITVAGRDSSGRIIRLTDATGRTVEAPQNGYIVPEIIADDSFWASDLNCNIYIKFDIKDKSGHTVSTEYGVIGEFIPPVDDELRASDGNTIYI